MSPLAIEATFLPAQKAEALEEPHSHDPRQLQVRYDGRAKVTGKATYAAEFPVKDVTYAWMVQSTVASATIAAMDISLAEKQPGVLAILTPFNTDKLPVPKPEPPARRHITILQDTQVDYQGQPIAVVVATSLDQARYAATLIRTTYKKKPALLQFKQRLLQARAPKQPGREPADATRGDMAKAVADSTIRIDVTYSTPIQHHNPMEPHATIAWWEGSKLNIYDATQYITGCKQSLAKTLGIALDDVRVQCPFTGGGFGSKGSMWSHVPLAAMAAKKVGKPVKLVLDRTQMFGPVGARPTTVQHLQLAATADGKLLGIEHNVIVHTSVMEDFLEPSAIQTRLLYASDANVTSHKMVDMNLGVGTFQRAPGEATGTVGLECALDELAHALKMDPVALRMKNYAQKDPGHDRPFTSKHLDTCYAQAAERFGWANRPATPASKREGNLLIGYGMATATYPANRSAAAAVVRLLASGRVFVGSGTQDLGTGTYTIMAQTAADGFSLDPTLVDVKLGDSTLPKAPVSGGSQSAASVCPAITDACGQAKIKLFELASNDTASPLHGLATDALSLRNGRVFSTASPDTGETFAALLTRNGGKPIEGMGSAEPGEDKTSATSQSFGAVFAEVAVDVDTHMVQVRRVVATYDIGTLMNAKTGINQLEGGIVWGVGTALHEATHLDENTGRFLNMNLAEYHVPVNRDIGTIDVTVVGIPDTKFNPLGARGIGEIGITGAAAAVGNAVFNATGIRVRDFPIAVEDLMAKA